MSEWKRNRLHVLRAERRWTQRKLADRIKVSQTMVSLWETATLEPDDRDKAKIAKAFGVDVDELIVKPAMEAQAS